MATIDKKPKTPTTTESSADKGRIAKPIDTGAEEKGKEASKK